MRLITKNGELDLPLDFTFEIEKTSTFFSSDGEQSIPVTLPATPRNLSALGQPLRLAGSRSALTRVDAVLHAGVIQRAGQLIISGASRDGITASLAINESDFYSKFSEVSIRELFSEHVRSEYTSASSWVDYFNGIIAGTTEDDEITLMPVLVEKNDITYLVLNDPDPSSGTTPQKLKWMERTISVGGSSEKVPDGYGVTPFIFLRAFISLMFSKMGFTVRSSMFDDDFFKEVVLLNNCADTICGGTLNYADIVPSCTVGEFLELLENKFNVYAFVSSETNVVDLASMDVKVTGVPDIDMSGQLDMNGEFKVDFGEREEIVTSSDTSLEGAEPPEENLATMARKYPVITSLDETAFRQDSRHYSTMLRLATGEYYRTETVVETGEYRVTRIGTNYFRHERNVDGKTREVTAGDIIPPMVIYNRSGEWNDLLLAPYIGARKHRHTSFNNEAMDEDQDVLFAFDAGLAVVDSFRTPSYRLATTQSYNNVGNKWHDGDLTPESLFERFFKDFGNLLLNCTTTLTAKVDLTPAQIQTFNMGRLKMLDGVLLLPKTINYTVGADIRCGESSFLVLKKHSDDIEESEIQFSRQYYTWEFTSSIDEDYDDLEEHYAIVEHTWLEDSGGDKEYIYLDPPTSEGVKAYFFKRTAHFRCTNEYGTDLHEEDREVDCWYESVPISSL